MSLRTKPGVTVVIPTFNRKNWLRIAIDSVLAETRVPIRLHVFDNASSDGTMDYMQSLENNRNVLYTRNPKNIGPLRNYTLALDHVRTRYFVPLADDDSLLPDFLYNAFQLLEGDHSLGAAIFVTEARFEDGSVQCTYPIERDKIRPGRMEPAEHLRSWMSNGHYAWSSILWRSETLDFVSYPYFHTGYPSDVDFQAQVFCKYPAIFVDEPGAVYRLHNEQTSRTCFDVSTLMSWASLFRRLDRRVMEFGLLPLNEYSLLRSVTAHRYREMWRRPSERPLSDGRLECLAVAAGFWLGDWEFAFSLVDQLKERARSLHLPRGLLQFPTLSSREECKPGSNEAALLGLRPMAAMLAGLRQYQCVLKSQAEQIEALSMRYAAMEGEVAQLRAEQSRMQATASQFAAERNALLKSTSWRLTAPLRWIKQRRR
jgi:glycosyltransferase involved in cell wall biosynthesis